MSLISENSQIPRPLEQNEPGGQRKITQGTALPKILACPCCHALISGYQRPILYLAKARMGKRSLTYCYSRYLLSV
jgi:hypothetical protein